MDKILSIRPTEQINILFDETRNLEGSHQEADRSAIVNRAIELATNKEIDWKHISKQKIEHSVQTAPSNFMKIRIEKSNYTTYCLIVEQIKNTFSLARVTSPYFIRLLLSFYLLELHKANSKDGILTVVNNMVECGVDCYVFKMEYDTSDYTLKSTLLELCRRYLEIYNPNMNDSIRKQINLKIQAYSDYFNVNRYFPIKRRTPGTCNIRFVSKVLAGLFLVVAEIFEYDLDEIVNTLRQETESKIVC